MSVFSTRLETAKEKISELEDIAEENMKNEVPRDKEMGNMKVKSIEYRVIRYWIYLVKVPEGENMGNGEIKYFKR